MSADSEEAKALAAEEAAIEMFKIKKLINSLEKARGYGLFPQYLCSIDFAFFVRNQTCYLF